MNIPPIAMLRGLNTCHTCGLLQKPASHHAECVRCGSALHARKPQSIHRAWALLIAALILYIPANVLPIMETRSILGEQSDTIMSGVVYLATHGSWPVALVIFFASILVPLAKMFALTLLLVTTQRRSRWRLSERTQLYRVVEFVGRWSMVDVYVVAILVALVQLGPLASISPAPGAIAFGAVVVLTMFAAESFDPRLMWDALDDRNDQQS
jgi:paraquat-inducible protein A